MPASTSGAGGGGIDKLDYHPGGRPLLQPDDNVDSSGRPSQATSYAGSFFEQVAEGIVDRDRVKMRREFARYLAFGWAILNWYGTSPVPHPVASGNGLCC